MAMALMVGLDALGRNRGYRILNACALVVGRKRYPGRDVHLGAKSAQASGEVIRRIDSSARDSSYQ